MKAGNLYADSVPPHAGERFDVLLEHKNLVVERIVSAADPAPTRCVQTQDEWVVLLRGVATLDIAGKPRELQSGDYVFLPAGTPHTVTAASEGALWLAVHLHAA